MLDGGWKLEIPSVKLTAKAPENMAIHFQGRTVGTGKVAAVEGDYRNGDPKNVGVRLQ